MRIRILLLFAVLFMTGMSWSQHVEHDHSIHHAFIENKGQWGDNVLFKSKFNGGNLWVEQGRFLFQLQDYSDVSTNHGKPDHKKTSALAKERYIELLFWGANDVTEIESSLPSKEYYNYFKGNDKSKWATNVHGYGEAVLHNFYDGIDMKLIENELELKYEFHVQPGIDPKLIQMEYNGHHEIKLNKKGDLVVKSDLGEIIEQKPFVYQIVNGNIREVECTFKLVESKLSFELGEYNPNAILIIDPVLVFATYSGSPSDNFGMTATYGYDGTAYSGGIVFGNSYPTPAPAWNTTTTITNVMPVANDPAGTYGVTDVFISKYSPDGVQMLWTCFLGGGDDTQGTETVHSLICDSSNNVYLYGSTSSSDFPIQNAYQNIHGGGIANVNFTSNGVHHYTNGTDIFVSKLSSNGLNLLGSTYMGGTNNDGLNYNANPGLVDSLTTNYGDPFRGEIMLDANNNVIVASSTRSTDFPVLNAIQSANAGRQDGVVFKLTTNLSTLIWSTYYGGSNNDACYSVKVDGSDNVIFAGGTASNDLSGMTGWQNSYNGGKTDGYVVKMPGDASSIIGGSYIGTANYDQAFFVEIDRIDQVYLVGQSQNGSFPIINSPFVNPGSSQFVIRLDPTLNVALNSTVFGSGNNAMDISPSAFLVDICGNIYISGWGKALGGSVPAINMPITTDALQSTTATPDFYLLVIERDFADTLYGTYIGGGQAGEHVDGGTSRFDSEGVVYQSVCGGCGGFSDFSTTPGAWSSTNDAGNCNNLIFKFDFELIPVADFAIDDNFGCLPFVVEFENNSTDSDSYLWDFGNGDTSSVIFEPIITFDTIGVYTVYLYVTDSICLLTDTAEITITVTDSLSLSTIPDQELCITTPIDFIAYTNDAATSFIWSSNINFTDTLNTDITDSIWTHTPSGPMTYYINASNSGCSGIDSVVVDFIGSALVLTANDSICAGEQTTITATNMNLTISFNYVWTPDSVILAPSITNSVTVNPTTSQYIYITATSNTGCIVNDSIQIYVGNIPTASVIATASETLVAEGSTVQLIGEPSGLSYIWSPGQGVINVNGQITDAVVDQTTIYTLTVTDGICAKTDTVLITTFQFICGDPYLYIPNAFSPNGDGENEILYVRGALVEEMVFRIYDRWGEMVFESFDRTDGWDGTFRGKALDPDVYDYYLDVTCVGGDEAIVKGNITLLR
ncbi:MAG: gliding motility-associated-like protein [Salibacteraceae bacterium]|jgi:gliding motility-associated-like protein